VKRPLAVVVALLLAVGGLAFGVPSASAVVVSGSSVSMNPGDIVVIQGGQYISILVLNSSYTVNFNQITYAMEDMTPTDVRDGNGDVIGSAMQGVALETEYLQLSLSAPYCGSYLGIPICGVDAGTVPKAMDVLTPSGVSQATELDPTLGPAVIQPVTVP